MRLGADAFLPKPFREEVFFQLLDGLLSDIHAMLQSLPVNSQKESW